MGLLLVAAGVSLWGELTSSPAASSLAAYRVLYRVEDLAGRAPVVTWEERVVQRPFRGRSVTFDSRPQPGAVPDRGALTSAREVYSYTTGGLQELAHRVPGLGAGDQVLMAVLGDAVERGLARRLGEREVLGRSCRVYRLAEPPNQPFVPLGGDDHDDVCLDRHGLLLSEEWTLDGRVVLRRRAVEIDTEPNAELLARALAIVDARPRPPNLPAPRIIDGAGTASVLPAPAPPAGFHRTDRVRLAVPLAFVNPSAPATADPLTVDAWVFTHGADLVSVEAGRGTPPWGSDDDSAGRVAVGRLGSATLALGPDGPELRVILDAWGWVRLRGTISADRLAAYGATISLPPA